jgi:hypothetical protein
MEGQSWCDPESLSDELEFLKYTFMENGIHQKQVHFTCDPPVRSNILGEKPALVTFLLYIQMNFACIRRLLYRHNIKIVGLYS